MPGPPPKPPGQRRRRNVVPALMLLPAEGRQGDVPRWPLGQAASGREAALWAHLWAMPQAVAWSRSALCHVVARYTRILTAAERRGARAAYLAETRQLEDRLGLTPMSMLRLRWTIEQATEPDEEPDVLDIRSRLQAVDPDLA